MTESIIHFRDFVGNTWDRTHLLFPKHLCILGLSYSFPLAKRDCRWSVHTHTGASFHIWIVVLSRSALKSINPSNSPLSGTDKGIGDKMIGVYFGERWSPTLSSFFRVSVVDMNMKIEPGIRIINTTLDTHDTAGGGKWKFRKLDQDPPNKTNSLLISK